MWRGTSANPVASSKTAVVPADAWALLSRCLAMVLSPKRKAIASRAFRGPRDFFGFPFDLRRAPLKGPLRLVAPWI